MPSLLDPRMFATEDNTYTPTKRDVGNLGGGLLSGFLGFPGDVQELARLGGNRAIGLLSQVNPVARQLGGLGVLLQGTAPTTPEIGQALGADPNTGAFMAGEIGAPDASDFRRVPGLLGMTLFHGTPHRFDKFDISKIGTGEEVFRKGLLDAPGGEYLFHGTSEGAFRRILQDGLDPSKANAEKGVFFADSEDVARSFSTRKGASYGPRVLRVKKTKDFVEDTRTGGGDFISKNKIPAKDLEVLTESGWVSLDKFSDPQIGIMPRD